MKYFFSRILNNLGNKLLAGNEHRFSRRFKSKHCPTTLKTPNPKLDLFVSSVMSLMEFLLCISIPFALLERPCEIFLQKQMYTIFEIVTVLEKYMPMIDRIIIALFIMLIYLSVDTVVVAIKNTIIKIS